MPKSIHKRALKIMQLTMNSNDVSVSKNGLVSWFSNAAKKISAVFATKKETPAVDKELTEAIRAIEWRTKYDTQRIANHVYTLTALVQSQKLCTALGVKEPTYTSQRFKNDRMNRFLLKSRTQELMLNEWGRDSYGIRTVNIIKTDNTFERKLVRWFGELNPTTKLLLDGKPTKNQRFILQNNRITELYIEKIPEMRFATTKSLKMNGYEREVLNALIALDTTVHSQTAQALPLESVASVKPEEKIIDVVAETLPVEAAPVAELQPPEQPSVNQVVVKIKSFSKKMTIKELKAYAAEYGIHVPGRKTKHRDIFEHIKAQQSA